jgi:hypothetical protein
MAWLSPTVPSSGIYGTITCYHIRMGKGSVRCKSQPGELVDELLEQIREDERADMLRRVRDLASNIEPGGQIDDQLAAENRTRQAN